MYLSTSHNAVLDDKQFRSDTSVQAGMGCKEEVISLQS